MNKSKCRACCLSRLINILSIMDNFYNFGFESGIVFRRLSNVLLSGIQNLEKEKDKNNALYHFNQAGTFGILDYSCIYNNLHFLAARHIDDLMELW